MSWRRKVPRSERVSTEKRWRVAGKDLFFPPPATHHPEVDTKELQVMGTLDKTTADSSTSERLLSIDALRGFDMFWIVGGEGLAEAIANWIGGPTKDFV